MYHCRSHAPGLAPPDSEFVEVVVVVLPNENDVGQLRCPCTDIPQRDEGIPTSSRTLNCRTLLVIARRTRISDHPSILGAA